MEKEKTDQLGYRGIFLERSGESSRAMVEVLSRPPEKELGEEEKEQVYDFENNLFDHKIGEFGTVGEILSQNQAEDIIAPMLFPDALRDKEVQANFPEVQFPDFATNQEAEEWFATAIKTKTMAPELLMSIAGASRQNYQEKMRSTLESDNGGSYQEDSIEAIPMVLDPESLRINILSHQKLRKYLLELRGFYDKQTEDTKAEAERAIIDIYLASVNGNIAQQIPLVDYLREQDQLTGSHDHSGLIPDNILKLLSSEARESFFKRLDYLRNGMGLNQGAADSVSDKLEEKISTGEVGQFSAEEVEQLKSTMVSPEEMRVIFENILKKAGLLSSEPASTWSPDRAGRAGDGLFQVVKNPSKNSFAVESVPGVYQYPASERSLYDVLTTGCFHELTHVSQAEADKKIAGRLKIATPKGKRVSGLREAGANANQRIAEKKLFGQSKPVAMTYKKALEALQAGGGLMGAAKAFYDEKVRLFPDGDKDKMADEASDRVLRLMRSGSNDSTPLVYAEEGILIDEFNENPEQIARATSVTCLDLVDQIRLHKYDLLPTVEIDGEIDWNELIMEELDGHISNAIHTTK